MSVIEWNCENVYEPRTEDLGRFCRCRSVERPTSSVSGPLVFVKRATIEQVKEHLREDVSREHGGILVGMAYRDTATGQEFVDVHAAIPAPRTVGTGVYLQFTADAWEHVSRRINTEFPGQIVVGWYHSHPGLGGFMSETEHGEFERHFRADPALERRFEPVRIEPPSASEAIEILTLARPEFEAYHQVQIAPSAIAAAVTLSERYLLDRYLPDKALDLLDHACARLRLHQRVESLAGSPRPTVDDAAIAEALGERLGVPIIKIGDDIRGRLTQLEGFLKGKVIGQSEAVQRIAVAVQQAYSGLRDPNRPRYVFAFFGPTGVGKTLTAKALAEFIFGSPDALIRLDMSEFKESHTISRLWGAPPGYVGYGDEGTFASRLRRQPFAVVLLDEFEKAHREVHDAFLQIFDEGRFSDARGRIVDARHALFILTSNLFADSFSNPALDASSTADGLRHQLATILRPELVNRVDDLIWFRSLDVGDLAHIVESQIRDLNDRLRKDGLEIVTTPEAVFWIANRVSDPQNGARAAIRAVTHFVTEPVASALAGRRLGSGSKLALRVRDGGLIIDRYVDRTDAGR